MKAVDNERPRLISIAAWVIAVVLLLYSASVICEMVGAVKGFQFRTPQHLVDFCHLAITAGLIVLGIPVAAKFLPKKRD